MRQLYNDICRCYGLDCPIKGECMRYLTISVDNPGLYSYQSNRQGEGRGSKECDSFWRINEQNGNESAKY